MDRTSPAATGPADARRAFVAVLQAAYSGELAAAYAYRGHWKSLWRSRRRDDRAEIQRIENAEWHHRARIGEILAELGEGPVRWREALMWSIGRFFGGLCYVGGYFGPIYAAGRLGASNVGQYADALGHAAAAGFGETYRSDLTEMIAEEDRHERFFAECIADHRLAGITSRVLGWDPRTPGQRAAVPVGSEGAE